MKKKVFNKMKHSNKTAAMLGITNAFLNCKNNFEDSLKLK